MLQCFILLLKLKCLLLKKSFSGTFYNIYISWMYCIKIFFHIFIYLTFLLDLMIRNWNRYKGFLLLIYLKMNHFFLKIRSNFWTHLIVHIYYKFIVYPFLVLINTKYIIIVQSLLWRNNFSRFANALKLDILSYL